MEKYLEKVKRIRRYYNSRKTNTRIKSFVKVKDPKVEYEKNFWSKNYDWDYYYQRRSNAVKSSHYVPYDYYVYKIQPKLNNSKQFLYVEDKQMYDRLYGHMDVVLPKTLFRCYEGVYMDENYVMIDDIHDFFNELQQDIFIKKTNGSHGGNGVEKYFFDGATYYNHSTEEQLDLECLYKRYQGNFIAQAVQEQHPALSELNPSSLNTLRIDSYRSVKTNKVHVLMGSIRMGRDGSVVDNVSSGGFAIGLRRDKDNEAYLREHSFPAFSNDKVSQHPDSKVVFKDYHIPGYPEIIKAVEKLSNIIPGYRIISWDFSVNPDGKAVLVELNSTGAIWGSQENNGAPLFGEFSEEVKAYVEQ